MENNVVILKPNCEPEAAHVELDLAGMQECVGGMIELVRLSPHFDMWVNEDGIHMGLEYNLTAGSSVILGTALITGGPTSDGETQGLTSDQIKLVLKVFNRPS